MAQVRRRVGPAIAEILAARSDAASGGIGKGNRHAHDPEVARSMKARTGAGIAMAERPGDTAAKQHHPFGGRPGVSRPSIYDHTSRPPPCPLVREGGSGSWTPLKIPTVGRTTSTAEYAVNR